MRKIIFLLLLSLVMIGSGVSSALAQDQATCLALTVAAANQTATQCASTGLDAACYGFADVTGSFREETAPGVFEKLTAQDFFVQPGNQADLLITEAIQTGPLQVSPDPRLWGMAVMNIQAGLPNEVVAAAGGKGVILVQLGGIELENDVEPQDALELPDGIAVTTLAAADMRMSPVVRDTPTSSNVIDRLPAEASANADAITPDGEWVRVVYQGQLGWINSATLQPTVDLSSLAQLGPENFMPMQSFFFRTGMQHNVPDQGCLLEPSILLVQGPPNIPVNLRIHRADIRLESTMLLRTVPPGDTLGDFVEIIPLFGMVTLFPDTDSEVRVPPGFVARLRLGEFVSLGIENDADEKVMRGLGGAIRALNRQEIERLEYLERLFAILENLLHYLPEIPNIAEPSGIGAALERISFDNPAALNLARIACRTGVLSPEVCDVLGLP
jgi:hypothetical protein